jgi:single-strand DNA-binding protein
MHSKVSEEQAMNRITISGLLGRAPELRYTNEGKPVLALSLAFSEGRDKPTTWFKVTCWDKLALRVDGWHLDKGALVLVDGRWKEMRSYDGRNGAGVSLEITANDVECLQKRSGGQEWASGAPMTVDELPF